jgi:alkylated DNA repair dioxygenase AlkB
VPVDVPVFERIELDGGSWIDVARGYLPDADEVYAHLEATVPWQQGKVWRYEKWVAEPRLSWGASRTNPGHVVLLDVQRDIERRYKARFDGFGINYYRNARDSVAMHRDREMRWLDDTVVAILTTTDLSPASGDLMVFGGRFQADYLHGVPKVQHAVRGRISIQWRYTSKRGRRDTNPGYYAPREFSSGGRRR